MKKSRFTMMMLIASMAMFFFACSDDNGTNPGNGDNAKDYYKMEVGNWWVYQNKSIDTNKNVIKDSEFIDTMKIVSNLNYKGKNSFLMTATRVLNGNKIVDTTYSAVEDSKLYFYFDKLGNDMFAIPFNGWLLQVDFNKTSWTALDTNIKDKEIQLQGITGKLTAKFKITGKKLSKENITVDGKTVEAQVFEQTISLDGTIDVGLNTSIPVNYSIPIKYWYAKNIGMAKSDQQAKKITFSIPRMYTKTIQIPGSNIMLLKYSVK